MHERPSGLSVLLAASIAFGSGACLEPVTPYRNVAMVPAVSMPQWDGRAEERGHLRVEGSVYHAHVIEDPYPAPHDSALRVPDTTVAGSLAVSVIDGLELGARVSYAHYQWTSRTARGTPPIPSMPSLVGIGPEMRGSFYVDKGHHFAIGGLAGVQIMTLPYARWEDPEAISIAAGNPPTATSRSLVLRDEGKKTMLVGQLALVPTFSFDRRYGHAFLSLSGQSSFRNDGFATESSAVALEGNGWVGVLGFGYGFQYDVFRTSLGFYLPLSGAANMRYLLGGVLTLGVDFDIFGTKKHSLVEEDPRPGTDSQTRPEGEPPAPASF